MFRGLEITFGFSKNPTVLFGRVSGGKRLKPSTNSHPNTPTFFKNRYDEFLKKCPHGDRGH